jgi:glycerate 2-kinase
VLNPRPSRHQSDPGDRVLELARARVRELFFAALDAVEPARVVRKSLDWRHDCLVVAGETLPAPLGVHVVAVGKAAIAMTRGALEVLHDVVVSGDVITTDGQDRALLPPGLRVHEAGHPIPDERGVKATDVTISALNRLGAGTAVLALISGGGSALLEAPRPGVSLADLAQTTDLLLRAGAPIEALNAVRSPLSRVKAGGLRAAAPRSPWATLILSDVLGNDPRIIASGPTVPGGSDPLVALEVIERFEVQTQVPLSVRAALSAPSAEPEPLHIRDDVLLVIADNGAAVGAAADKASALGLECRVVWQAAQGEAADLGREFISLVVGVPELIDVVLGGGEATVTVRGEGRGGRNTEFTLAAALELERQRLMDWVIASLGTDGQDAMTGLAGAIADAGTPQRARDAGVDPVRALARNDSQSVFDAAGGSVETGPTGTNVNDVYIAVRAKNRLESERGGGS